MSAAHVRRGGAGRAKAKKPAKVTVPKKFAKRLPVNQARANKVAGLVFGAFMLAIALVVLVALDIPAKAERAEAPRRTWAAAFIARPPRSGARRARRKECPAISPARGPG